MVAEIFSHVRHLNDKRLRCAYKDHARRSALKIFNRFGCQSGPISFTATASTHQRACCDTRTTS